MILLLLLPLAVVQAQFTFVTNSGSITITDYNGPGGAVTIPDTITGLPVTRIGSRAFKSKTGLTSVRIPDPVITVGDEAFAYSGSLTNVLLGTNVASLQNNAFGGCAGLTVVAIPSSVTNIGPYPVFLGCGNLTNIAVDSLNFAYCSMDGILFNKSKTTLLTYPAGMPESHYTIPDSVVSIGHSAFLGPLNLTSVTIPNGVTYLDQFAFYMCFNLTNVSMGSGVTNIGPNAFYVCWSLTNIALPNSVTSIGDGAFYYCSSLVNITIPAGITRIGDAAFCYTYSLTGVYFQGNTPSLGGPSVFCGNNTATVYYLPGTTNWGPTFGGRPTALWRPQIQTSDASFGVRTNHFGFNVAWASGQVVVVEACTNLANPIWSPLQTNTLTDGSSYFSDPQWTNYPSRFYRLRSP